MFEPHQKAPKTDDDDAEIGWILTSVCSKTKPIQKNLLKWMQIHS